jgi:hypothetical protein
MNSIGSGLSFVLKISYVYKKYIFMKRVLIIISFLILLCHQEVVSQSGNDTVVYLITCGPGTETYSIYGHSALRIVIPEKNSDLVYNWGVFDFNTTNFAWKFAKGRLDYLLDTQRMQRFLQSYFYEQRYVNSQIINLYPNEKLQLLTLINENIKPENTKYRYDFFYDDCSTRIRDLLEKAIGSKLLYPPVETLKPPTFRHMVGKYQNPFPWLNFGIDLIMGSPGDKKAYFRDRMFLPLDMQAALSEAVINRDGKMIPLLQNSEGILDFDPLSIKQRFYLTPVFIFTLLFVIVVILSGLIKTREKNRQFDIVVYSVYSVLSLLMIFFNFFTDHQQMKWNLNILWLNPFIFFCLGSLILNKAGTIWFRIVFIISAIFIVLHFFLPQEFNMAFIPLVVILLVRSSVRGQFEWNPITLK